MMPADLFRYSHLFPPVPGTGAMSDSTPVPIPLPLGNRSGTGRKAEPQDLTRSAISEARDASL